MSFSNERAGIFSSFLFINCWKSSFCSFLFSIEIEETQIEILPAIFAKGHDFGAGSFMTAISITLRPLSTGSVK